MDNRAEAILLKTEKPRFNAELAKKYLVSLREYLSYELTEENIRDGVTKDLWIEGHAVGYLYGYMVEASAKQGIETVLQSCDISFEEFHAMMVTYIDALSKVAFEELDVLSELKVWVDDGAERLPRGGGAFGSHYRTLRNLMTMRNSFGFGPVEGIEKKLDDLAFMAAVAEAGDIFGLKDWLTREMKLSEIEEWISIAAKNDDMAELKKRMGMNDEFYARFNERIALDRVKTDLDRCIGPEASETSGYLVMHAARRLLKIGYHQVSNHKFRNGLFYKMKDGSYLDKPRFEAMLKEQPRPSDQYVLRQWFGR